MKRNDKGLFVKQPLEEKFKSKVPKGLPSNECWNWLGRTDQKGYGMLTEYDDSNKFKKNHLAHRLSYQFYNGDIPEGNVICHKCDNPSCINPNHLFAGTQKDNMQDMITKGRSVPNNLRARKGENNGSAKLSESDVLSMREKYKPRKYTVKMLALEYGVSVPLVEKVLSRKLWIHI